MNVSFKDIRLSLIILVAFTVLWVFYSSLSIQGAVFDDSYIHFRIASNLAEHGQGFYNLNDPVMSTSSPAWTWLLALMSFLGVALPFGVLVLNNFLVIIGALVWTWCLKLFSSAKNLNWVHMAFFIGYVGVLTRSAFGLMETPFALLILGLSILAVYNEKKIGWILLAFASFIRMELIVFFPILSVVVWLAQSRRNLTFGLGLFITTFTSLLFLTYFIFDAFIPNTIAAKQTVYDLSKSDVLMGIYSSLLPMKGGSQKIVGFVYAVIIAFLTGLGLCKASLSDYWSRKSNLAWAFGVGVGGFAIILAYVSKAVFVHEWYEPLFVMPILFFSAFLASSGLTWKVIYGSLLAKPILMLAVVTLGATWPDQLPGRESGARVQRYLEVGAILNEYLPNARLMTSEIGALGAAFNGHIIDGMGLITPAALAYHPMNVGTQRSNGGIGAIPKNFVEVELPEVIVSYPVFVEEFDVSAVASKYQKIVIPAFSKKVQDRIRSVSIWGNTELFIYIRNDLASSDAMLLENIRSKLENESIP